LKRFGIGNCRGAIGAALAEDEGKKIYLRNSAYGAISTKHHQVVILV
jgi:hypothetical protein